MSEKKDIPPPAVNSKTEHKETAVNRAEIPVKDVPKNRQILRNRSPGNMNSQNQGECIIS